MPADPFDDTQRIKDPVDPFDETQAPSGTLADVGKSVVSEAAKAPLRPVGLIGDVRAGLEGARDWLGRVLGTDKLAEEAQKRLTPEELQKLKQPRGAPTTEDLARGVERATGAEFHRPETEYGRYAGAVSAGVADPLSLLMGPGNIVRRLIVGGVSGAGGELGGEVAGPVGALVGGGLTSAGLERSIAASQRATQRRQLATTAPTVQAVDAAAQQDYRRAGQLNVSLDRADVSQLGTDIRQDLVTGTATGHKFSPVNQPKTFREIEKLENQVRLRKPGLRRTFGAGGPIGPGTARPPSSSDEVIAIRDSLQDIRRDHPGTSEALAASHAIDRVDAYLDTVSGVNVPLRTARANYRPARRAEDLENAIYEAGLSQGTNLGTAMRNGVKKILLNDKLPKTPQERQRMQEIVEGGGIPRALATLTGHHAYLAVWLLAHGHPIGALESIIPGLMGRSLDARRTRRAIVDLRDDILRSSPAGGGAMPTRLPQWTPGTGPASAARAIDDALRQTDDPLQ